MHAASIDACSIITRCLSLPKRNDKSVWKMQFSAPSQWHKIRFEYQRNHIQWKRPKIFTNAYGQASGVTPPPRPYGQPDHKKPVSVFDDFPYQLFSLRILELASLFVSCFVIRIYSDVRLYQNFIFVTLCCNYGNVNKDVMGRRVCSHSVSTYQYV